MKKLLISHFERNPRIFVTTPLLIDLILKKKHIQLIQLPKVWLEKELVLKASSIDISSGGSLD